MPASRSRTHFLVGLFVVGGIGLILAIFIWLGVTRYFEKGNYYLCFFDESVQGLSTDAPVKYLGVPVGRVDSIQVAPDGRLIQVVIIIETDLSLNKNFVAQVTSVGITGGMFIELERDEQAKDTIPSLDFSTEYQVIGSKPSELSRIMSRAEEFLTMISKLDLEGLIDTFKNSLENVDKTLNQAELKQVFSEIHSAAANVRQLAGMSNWNSTLLALEQGGQDFSQTMLTAQKSLSSSGELVDNLDNLIKSNTKEMVATLNEIQTMIKHSATFFKGAGQFVQQGETSLTQLQSQFLTISQSLERSSRNLEQLTKSLAENPSQLIFSQPPKPRKLRD